MQQTEVWVVANKAKKPLPSQSAILKANKKRKIASNVFTKFKFVFNSFVGYQQVADKSSLKAARGGKTEGRGGERSKEWRSKSKEDQDFLLKRAQVLHKLIHVKVPATVSSSVLTFCASC